MRYTCLLIALSILADVAVAQTRSSAPPFKVLEKNRPSVARLVVRDATGQQRVASAVVIDDDGYLVADYRFLEGVNAARVEFAGGRSFTDVRLLATDTDHQVVILRIPANDLRAPRFGEHFGQRLGASLVLVVGAPSRTGAMLAGGQVTNSFFASPAQRADTSPAFPVYFQFAAPVQSGNIGGAVFNEFGELIGIMTSATTGLVQKQIAVPAGQQVHQDIPVVTAVWLSYVRELLKRCKASDTPGRGLESLPIAPADGATSDQLEQSPKQRIFLSSVFPYPEVMAALKHVVAVDTRWTIVDKPEDSTLTLLISVMEHKVTYTRSGLAASSASYTRSYQVAASLRDSDSAAEVWSASKTMDNSGKDVMRRLGERLGQEFITETKAILSPRRR